MKASTTLAFFAPLAFAVADVEKLSISPSFWVKGCSASLQLAIDDSKKCPQIAVEFKSKTESFTQSIKAPASKNGTVELDLTPHLGRLKPGEIQITALCPQALGQVKIQILKPLEKPDFDKASVEQLEKVAAVLYTSHGSMLLEFYPKKAPNTVRNFLKLSAKGFYDGTPFHRIIKNFMAQGGDPTGTGSGDPGYTIKAEFNDLPHIKGTISMARSEDPDSAGCQFFLVHGEHASNLDRNYTAFGKTIEGLETLDRIASVPVGMSDGGEESKPLESVVLKKVILVEKPAVPAETKKP